MTPTERKAYNAERARKWRKKNLEHNREYQRVYKQKMRAK